MTIWLMSMKTVEWGERAAYTKTCHRGFPYICEKVERYAHRHNSRTPVIKSVIKIANFGRCVELKGF
jgi:hypothetical protein